MMTLSAKKTTQPHHHAANSINRYKGILWRDLLPEFGEWNSVFQRLMPSCGEQDQQILLF
ncbi:hypothetical protein PSI15_12145 [Xenorhabdus sp. PR6a]|uniref:hypothetical protein n=1 Tax=Xenorhabdus sp. PR6a TaxID=3025877 RepID=UPI002358B746|nr:hypothetical protein [Xenorhabdus sp. PR6a]MDC9582305.1 hypothetical protein [Xenorhabdus sp. PR6a]